jgi:hypothetical protein
MDSAMLISWGSWKPAGQETHHALLLINICNHFPLWLEAQNPNYRDCVTQ